MPDLTDFSSKPLRYLIGADVAPPGQPNEVVEVGYDVDKVPPRAGGAIAYCNLLSEEGEVRRYQPYRAKTDTAAEYDEGVPDPKGPGFALNLRDQFERRRKAGFKAVELDNPDAYHLADVNTAIYTANQYGLRVVAKNPLLIPGQGTSVRYLAQCFGAIVEEDAGGPYSMDKLRKAAGMDYAPVWFVAFGDGHTWGVSVARQIQHKGYKNMGVTYSKRGEYGSSTDLWVPT